MSRKKNKTDRRATRTSQRRTVVFGGEPKMSEIILDLADPLLDGDVSDPKEVADGDAEQVAAIIQAMEIIDDRRKKLFPKLRRFVGRHIEPCPPGSMFADYLRRHGGDHVAME